MLTFQKIPRAKIKSMAPTAIPGTEFGAYFGDSGPYKALMACESFGSPELGSRYFLPGTPNSRNFLSHFPEAAERKDNTPLFNWPTFSSVSLYQNALFHVTLLGGSDA